MTILTVYDYLEKISIYWEERALGSETAAESLLCSLAAEWSLGFGNYLEELFFLSTVKVRRVFVGGELDEWLLLAFVLFFRFYMSLFKACRGYWSAGEQGVAASASFFVFKGIILSFALFHCLFCHDSDYGTVFNGCLFCGKFLFSCHFKLVFLMNPFYAYVSFTGFGGLFFFFFFLASVRIFSKAENFWSRGFIFWLFFWHFFCEIAFRRYFCLYSLIYFVGIIFVVCIFFLLLFFPPTDDVISSYSSLLPCW